MTADDFKKAKALLNGFIEAEIKLGLDWQEPLPIKERAHRILRMAMHRPIAPGLYALCVGCPPEHELRDIRTGR